MEKTVRRMIEKIVGLTSLWPNVHWKSPSPKRTRPIIHQNLSHHLHRAFILKASQLEAAVILTFSSHVVVPSETHSRRGSVWVLSHIISKEIEAFAHPVVELVHAHVSTR